MLHFIYFLIRLLQNIPMILIGRIAQAKFYQKRACPHRSSLPRVYLCHTRWICRNPDNRTVLASTGGTRCFHTSDAASLGCIGDMVAVHGESIAAALVAFSLAKKVTVYGVARFYGFSRIYRKLVKMNRRIGAPPESQHKFGTSVKVS